MYNKIKMSIRGLLSKLIHFKKWKMYLKGQHVRAKIGSFSHNDILVLNDFVELRGKKQNIEFGEKCSIGKYSIIKAEFCEKSFFRVGNNFGCGEFCFFGCAGGLTIGNDVMMGQNVRFHAQNHIFMDKNSTISAQGTTENGIVVGNDCWFGSGSVILDGVTIGNGCVIAANSTVNKDVPDFAVVAGNPAKIIKYRGEL